MLSEHISGQNITRYQDYLEPWHLGLQIARPNSFCALNNASKLAVLEQNKFCSIGNRSFGILRIRCHSTMSA